jgi:hypothetical protein
MITARYHQPPAVVGDLLNATAISPAVLSECRHLANGGSQKKSGFAAF